MKGGKSLTGLPAFFSYRLEIMKLLTETNWEEWEKK